MASLSFHWTGTHVSGARPSALVRYHGPTDRKGSRWIATIKRGKEEAFRASVPFSDGPIAAAEAAAEKLCEKYGTAEAWLPSLCSSVDGVGDAYLISF